SAEGGGSSMGHLGCLALLIFIFQISGKMRESLLRVREEWCNKDEFTCRSRRCISTELLCNAVDDCGDGSDEDSCQNCTSGVFSCGPSDACLPKDKVCDGRADCTSKRDESLELCGSDQPVAQTAPTCAPSEFRCGDGECIRHVWRCDNTPDCSDGSDEEDCSEKKIFDFFFFNNSYFSIGCRRFNAVETVVFAFIILCAFLLKLLSYLSNGSMKSSSLSDFFFLIIF
uniref:Uncharacterized protein n=1 Tax=Oryzias melastigma TaxID=30732 RepID=A0A3B3B8T9_ORYME